MKKILAVALLLGCFAGTVMADGSGQSPPKTPSRTVLVVAV
jgi:hypothetical protein